MSAPTADVAPVKEKAKSKKLLLIVIAVIIVLLVIGGGAAAWIISSRSHAVEDEEGHAGEPAEESHKVPPTFLAMENMVVNLSDTGGDRFAQIGITLEVADTKTADQIKQYLPSIRSGILLLISQRTSAELLQREGKEKLALDILREVSQPLGHVVPVKGAHAAASERGAAAEKRKSAKTPEENPVQRVLFSSFIIQ